MNFNKAHPAMLHVINKFYNVFMRWAKKKRISDLYQFNWYVLNRIIKSYQVFP